MDLAVRGRQLHNKVWSLTCWSKVQPFENTHRANLASHTSPWHQLAFLSGKADLTSHSLLETGETYFTALQLLKDHYLATQLFIILYNILYVKCALVLSIAHYKSIHGSFMYVLYNQLMLPCQPTEYLCIFQTNMSCGSQQLDHFLF